MIVRCLPPLTEHPSVFTIVRCLAPLTEQLLEGLQESSQEWSNAHLPFCGPEILELQEDALIGQLRPLLPVNGNIIVALY